MKTGHKTLAVAFSVLTAALALGFAAKLEAGEKAGNNK